MHLQRAVDHALVQLDAILHQLSPQEYARPSAILNHNSIGQHVRHIIESFQCLETGYASGVINYEKRKRDIVIETDKDLAAHLLKTIVTNLHKPDKMLLLEARYGDFETEEPVTFNTNFYREIAYNLEHTIHHMALVRVGIAELKTVSIPENFGVAPSTVNYRKQCAQ